MDVYADREDYEVDRQQTDEAVQIMTSLSLGRREAVREIVANAQHRGLLDERAKEFLRSATGDDCLANLIIEALAADRTEGYQVLSMPAPGVHGPNLRRIGMLEQDRPPATTAQAELPRLCSDWQSSRSDR